jgi:hypothetical protein
MTAVCKQQEDTVTSWLIHESTNTGSKTESLWHHTFLYYLPPWCRIVMFYKLQACTFVHYTRHGFQLTVASHGKKTYKCQVDRLCTELYLRPDNDSQITSCLTSCDIWVSGAFSLVVKWPELEADHSPPSSAVVKNAWSYTSSPQYAFMAWCSVKAQGQLYLYLC